jgi:hypothetical protein
MSGAFGYRRMRGKVMIIAGFGFLLAKKGSAGVNKCGGLPLAEC